MDQNKGVLGVGEEMLYFVVGSIWFLGYFCCCDEYSFLEQVFEWFFSYMIVFQLYQGI